ncbi:hypothetical protein DM02DRAFT_665738 [Periconia macrospinosa]|uniref:Uncharacterized protein n=1 Tax=Periconia macrospinosa TaxID=97972 RepID=A0A2V1EF85_9PLEO|nr:hypothetical protein DM02DRAFT_665738 [Periconia macrospinosa]
MLVTLLIPLLALANAKAIERRDDASSVTNADSSPDSFHFKTHDPHFIHLEVEDDCKRWKRDDDEFAEDEDEVDEDEDAEEDDDAASRFLPSKWGKKKPWTTCLAGYAIRLEKGIVVATPYKKWYDPKLATMFVDEDTQLYTVSKEPLQLYIDSVTGAFKYTKLGWLPPSAISTSFYHTGNNPLGLTNPSPSYLSWPSTVGIAFNGYWAFCPLGGTGQFQVFVNNANFAQQGVHKDWCRFKRIAAVNANPWKKPPHEWEEEHSHDWQE